MARGGQRTAKPGSMLPNRSDMRTTQPIRTAPGQPYGEAGAQAAVQAQVPLANGAAAPVATQPEPTPPPMPGSLGSMFDPSTRPGEPVTHGAASGPGAGPEILTGAPAHMADPATVAVRAAYAAFPVEGLREILENLDAQS